MGRYVETLGRETGCVTRLEIPFTPSNRFREKLYGWTADFEHAAVLDSNKNEDTSYPGGTNYDLLAAAEALEHIEPTTHPFEQLRAFREAHADWCFGHFNYDLKNEVEALHSANPDPIGFPLLSFFVPRWVITCRQENWCIHVRPEDETLVPTLLADIEMRETTPASLPECSLEPTLSRSEYLEHVRALQQHIRLGDIYEANYCQEFRGTVSGPFAPEALHRQLIAASPMPFAAFYRCRERFLLSASPERFVQKTGDRLVSQPIKGTCKRGNTPEEDQQLQEALFVNEKERRENVMIVDLVRNDLSRSAQPQSVVVDELFGTYPFPNVHHMISTVSCTLREDVSSEEAIRHLFPMGSMTGAPKIKAMELIDRYESFQRGLYSGSVGYFTPTGDFDFNVVIRSILYSQETGVLSAPVGGAITALSDPEAEYEESLLKIRSIRNLFPSEVVAY